MFGWIGSKVGLAAHDIEGIPGGTYKILKDTAIVATHPSYSTDRHKKSPLVADAKGLAVSSAQALRHPLRDPFQTATLLAPGADVAGRFGEAGIAAKEGDLAGASRALVRHHGSDVAPRVIRHGEKDTNLIPSRNAGVRLVQRGYDRMVQRALDREAAGAKVGRATGHVARHGAKRVAGALREEGRIQERMRQVPANLLDASAKKLLRTPGQRREEEAALELTSHQVPAEEAAAYHYGQAAKGVNRKENAHVAKIYERVAKQNLVHVDESAAAGRKVFINPAHKRLAAADKALARVQSRGDTILAKHGIMSGEQLAQRANAPARIRAGARYEKPTPGKLGVESPQLVGARAKVARLEKAHARETLRALKTKRSAGFPGRLTYEGEAPPRGIQHMSDEELVSRAKALDGRYEKLVDQLAEAEGKPYKVDVAMRNLSARRLARKGRPNITARQELRNIAETKLLKLVETHPDEPLVKRLTAEIDESTALHKEIAARNDAALGIGGHEQQPTPAAERRPVFANPAENSPTVARLSSALSVAKDELQRLEQTHAGRIKETGIVGGETARPGRGFVSERISQKRLARAEAAHSSGPVTGVARPPIDKKPFTGRAIEQGLRPKSVTASASHHYRQIARFDATDALRRTALETGSDVRRSARDVLIRKPDETAPQLDAKTRQLLGQETSTIDNPEESAATAEGLAAAHRMFAQRILDRAASSAHEQVGVEAPEGYRWVDKNVIGGLQEAARPKGGPGAKLGRAVDNANSAITALTVYFKVGHIGTRVLTNAATNIMEGSAAPTEIARSYKLWEKLGPEDKARLLAASGQHGFSALPHEGTEGLIGKGISTAAGGGAKFWARHADAPFRFNGLAYELRKAGYTTVDEVKRALDGLETGGKGLPAHEWSKISAAARRADRELISYDRLNDFERRYLTRGIWFYPWVKGATLWSVRSFIEHPYKGALIGAAGVKGRQEQQHVLGDVPSYEEGLVPLGHGKRPNTTDFSTFSPFATLGQELNVPRIPGSFAGQLNPVAGAGGQLAYGLNQYGAPSKRPYLDALLALAAATPEQQLGESFAQRGKDQSNRMFVKTPGATALRYLLGPAYPRRVNKAALAKAAARERSGQR